MKNKLTSLLKTLVISTFILATTAAYADYYVVYDTSDAAARCGSCVARHHYRHYVHHYYHHSCHPRRHYTNRSYPIRVYYAWQVLPNTNCNGGCGESVSPASYTCRHVEYPPHYPGYREYYSQTYSDNYNYNGDMRTADDDGS